MNCQPKKRKKVKLIYIAGYGRSGSTLLDQLLGMHAEIASVGEFINLSEWCSVNDLCSCGTPVNSCAFWSKVLTGIKPNNEATVSFVKYSWSARFRFFIIKLFKRSLKEKDLKTAELNQRIFEKVAELVEKQYVLDSSKDFGQLFAFAASDLFDIKIIHLIRDGRGVAYSRTKKHAFNLSSTKPSKYIIPRPVGYTTRRWAITNMIFFIAHCLFFRKNYILLRYEDLVQHSQESLALLYKFLDIKDIGVPKKNIPCHNIGGNNRRFTFNNNIQLDQGWKDRLRPWDYFLFRLNGGSFVNFISNSLSKH